MAFREIPMPQRPETHSIGHDRIVIVGAGIAGISAAESVREHAPDAEIVIISKEPEYPYYRLNLTRLLAGDIAEESLPLHSPEWFSEHRIDFMPGTSVESIQLTEKTLLLQDGRSIHFDKLIMATGSQPWVPSIPGTDLDNVFTIRTLDDVRNVLAVVKSGSRVACIGGGILGMETASALVKREAEVTLLEAFDYLMPRQLNPEGGGVLRQHLEKLGIEVITSAIADCLVGDGQVTGVHLKRGQLVTSDVVVITAGDRADTRLLQEIGITVNKGVLVDNYLRTTNPDIFAIGDVCEHDGMIYGSWDAAKYQGRIAGMNAAGKPTEFGGIPRSHLLKVVGKPMLSIGIVTPPDGSYRKIEDFPDQGYRMFMFRDGCLVGALIVGKLTLLKALHWAIQMRLDMRTLLASQPTAQEVADWLGNEYRNATAKKNSKPRREMLET